MEAWEAKSDSTPPRGASRQHLAQPVRGGKVELTVSRKSLEYLVLSGPSKWRSKCLQLLVGKWPRITHHLSPDLSQ